MTFSFKKTLVAAATLSALAIASPSFADNHSDHDNTNYKKWVGVFGQYYHPDGDKPNEIGGGFLQDGAALGGEFGIRFTPRWAMRIEAAKTNVDVDNNAFGVGSVDGQKIAADALYFQDDLQTYLFTGLQHADDDFDDYLAVAAGIGKHWSLSENTRLITEATAYHAFSDSYNDFSVKLGVAYVFGEIAPSYAPAKRASDADRDGVVDSLDNCPNTLAGTSVDTRGCSLDADRDGVADSIDQCLSTPKGDKVNTSGCSVMVAEEIEVRLSALFANNSSVIQNPADVKFAEFADFLKRYPKATGVVEGHTSIVGTAAYNQLLSQKRAEAVKALLISRYGAPADRITALGFGESQPVNLANTPAAHRENRRIIGVVKVMVESKTK
ncbi:MAG: OmpA family protein [Glaciecola sp.]|nr:OmpA family protein [Glaciecola sp.]